MEIQVTWNRPKLYRKQEAAIFCNSRYAVIEASTKAGKTVGCIVWLLEQAWAGQPGWEYWWVAPIFAQAAIAFRRVKLNLTHGSFVASESNLAITLLNGAVIRFKSADKPDSLYGDDVHAAVIDEASRCKEEAFIAIRSTLTATRGPIRIIGNVRGRKNWAYRLARKAEGGNPDMHYAKLTAWDAVEAGVLHRDEVEDAKRNLPDRAFQELYLADPADDEGNPFGIEAIRRCIGPLSEAEPDCWGWDLAKSVDWTVGIGLDRDGMTCRFERYQAPWQDTIARIRRSTGATQALVDSTGVGDPILEHLQKNTTNFEGLKFTQFTKQQLMEGLAAAIQSQAISFPDGQIVSELEQFGYEYTQNGGVRYSAPEGFHDDCVVALALAVRKRSRPPLQDAVVMLNEYTALRDY